ncbi:hypothetical protein MTR67_043588 [Solanum verrucosum]|uniref:Tf2-1-like SH3-like domain-containing protein n=1 Tax=Solanum verrucosum TaxID=315347 RepID=A0AAF0URN4_SOLVR|nr:hypothetical protein MTR67_043588 [Solanum verrucosum]
MWLPCTSRKWFTRVGLGLSFGIRSQFRPSSLGSDRQGGLLQDIPIPTWMCEEVNMDFIVGFPCTRRQDDSIFVIIDRMTKSANFITVKVSHSAKVYAKLYISEIVKCHGIPFSNIFDRDFKGNWDDHFRLIKFAYYIRYPSRIGKAPFEALYGKRCSSPIDWFEVGEIALMGPESVYEAIKRRDLGFEMNDWVYFKISPIKGVMRFGKKGKLSPPYVGPYKILQRIGKVAYELDLPKEFTAVHPVFHVSMLKKCIGDPTSIIHLEGLGVDASLSYEEVPVENLDRQIKWVRNKEIDSMKVLCRNNLVEGATWEFEVDMKS